MNRITLATIPNWAATGLRVALGSVLFAHGAQSLLGWFGGFFAHCAGVNNQHGIGEGCLCQRSH
jgi:putative oxidoreductase